MLTRIISITLFLIIATVQLNGGIRGTIQRGSHPTVSSVLAMPLGATQMDEQTALSLPRKVMKY